ncbi:MAG: F-box protein [Chlamydiales bacterium]|nr:F-box protein [Chlamydiales bacterium]
MMTSSSPSSLSSSSPSSTTTGLKRSSDKNPKKNTLTLPNSLVIEILLYLGDKEIRISARVCKQWREVQACRIVQEELITRYAFGKRQWNTYFGDIGEELPLPSDIGTILASPCPIWSGKQVRETHLAHPSAS